MMDGITKLVELTKIAGYLMPTSSGNRRRTTAGHFPTWTLQDAKARLSEVLRRARSEGPQRLTVHGRDEAVILSSEEFRRLKGELTGQALIDALQACPYPDLDLEVQSVRTAAHDITL
jgi:prevent-host-death family protein